MNLLNAEKIFGLTKGIYTAKNIKEIFRKLAKENHPDKGGNVETMQLINQAYNDFSKYFINNAEYVVKNDQENHSINLEFINELKSMTGIVIEIVNYWVWLTGNTFAYKDQLKILGFRYSGGKKAWYWAPDLSEKKKRGTLSLKNIRNKYGSKIIETESAKLLTA